jgi:hypothetical protein
MCAGCYRDGKRTELNGTDDEVTVIIDKFGAHIDMCEDCQQKMLFPLLEMMSTSDDLSGMPRWEFAALGSVRPDPAMFAKPAVAGLPNVQPAAQAVTGGRRPGKAAKPGKRTRKPAVSIDTVGLQAVPVSELAFACDMCGARFATDAGLDRHHRRYGGRPHDLPARQKQLLDRGSHAAEPSAPVTLPQNSSSQAAVSSEIADTAGQLTAA